MRATRSVVVGVGAGAAVLLVLVGAVLWVALRPAAPISDTVGGTYADAVRATDGRMDSVLDASEQVLGEEPAYEPAFEPGRRARVDATFTVIAACSSTGRVDDTDVSFVILPTDRVTREVRRRAAAGGYDALCD
ncbi:MAG: hypothetical protein PGN07_00790 [Aeromicrobium erythreum]